MITQNLRNKHAAEIYAARFKFQVFPIKPKGKTPITTHGLKDGTLDPLKIGEFWSKSPDANIGIVTGQASGVLVIDIDPRHNGDKSFEEIKVKYGSLPPTPTVKTGGGGLHIFFKHPGGKIGNKANLFPGVDVRGDGGYVVSPPSIHESGNKYEWQQDARIDEIPLADIPTWLLDLLKQKDKPSTLHNLNSFFLEGQRNDGLFRFACSLRAKGEPEGSIFNAIKAENLLNCCPPLDDEEITNIARQASQYAPGKTSIGNLNNQGRDDFEKLFIPEKRKWPKPLANEAGSQEEKSWQARKALPSILPSAPPLPEHLIPEPLRPWVTDSAKRMSVPLEFIAAPLLGAIASVIGRKVGICPKKYDSWLVVLVLWVALIGRPSKKKTPAYEQALKPLQFLEEKAIEEYKKSLPQQEALLEINKAKTEAIKEDIKKAARTKGKSDQLHGLQADLAATLSENEDTLIEKRYSTNDSTVEKLALLINENPNGILLKRDELYGFFKSLDKSGREGDREFYLEAANGKGRFTVDRISRSTIHVPALRIGIIGGIQPGKLQNYVFDAAMGGVGDDGLLQRFNFLIYPDKESFELPYVDAAEDIEAYNQVQNIFEFLDILIPENLGAKIIGNEKIPAFRFEDDAQELFTQWIMELEDRLKDENLDPLLEAHIGKYRSLMPGLALEFHVIDLAAGERAGAISLKAVKLAAAWCEYLELHAQKVYSIAINSEIVSAHALIKKIKEGKVCDGDSVRGIYRHHWSRLTTQAEVEAALSVLEKHNWVRLFHVKNKEVGPPTEIVKLHPELIRGDQHEEV